MGKAVEVSAQSRIERLKSAYYGTLARGHVALGAAPVAAAGGVPEIKPNQNGLPGINQATNIVGAIMTFALVGCGLAIIIGAARWALGNQSHNYQQSSGGKQQVMGGVGAAIVIGAAVALVRFFFGVGGGVHA